MVERFLRYSLESGKRIRVMLLSQGEGERAVCVKALTVTRFSPQEGAFYARAGRGAEKRYALADVLSAGYARGDREQG